MTGTKSYADRLITLIEKHDLDALDVPGGRWDGGEPRQLTPPQPTSKSSQLGTISTKQCKKTAKSVVLVSIVQNFNNRICCQTIIFCRIGPKRI